MKIISKIGKQGEEPEGMNMLKTQRTSIIIKETQVLKEFLISLLH